MGVSCFKIFWISFYLREFSTEFLDWSWGIDRVLRLIILCEAKEPPLFVWFWYLGRNFLPRLATNSRCHLLESLEELRELTETPTQCDCVSRAPIMLAQKDIDVKKHYLPNFDGPSCFSKSFNALLFRPEVNLEHKKFFGKRKYSADVTFLGLFNEEISPCVFSLMDHV